MIVPYKIFSTAQIRAADEYTIKHEPIASIDLMERAANKCFEKITQLFSTDRSFIVFCGPGNNGGDGLAIARLLHMASYKVKVFVIRYADKCSDDFLMNEQRLNDLNKILLHNINNIDDFPTISDQDIVIDAIFGTGLTKTVQGLAAECISSINKSNAFIIAIDLPSGLYADQHSDPSAPIIKANLTLSFQFCKLAFLFPENEIFVGNWEILVIGLSSQFIEQEATNNYYLTESSIRNLIKPRKKISHKGTYGHAFLIAGSIGKIGAAVLAAKACLKSGVGLLTVQTPACGYDVLQTSAPEAMHIADSSHKILQDIPQIEKYTAIGIGPGIDQHYSTQKVLEYLFEQSKNPLVLDADALNIISQHKSLLKKIPAYSILTPHPKEFERLTESVNNDFERHALQLNFSKKHKVYVVLKGAHTCITTPEGMSYFNSTGNPGMAKGGSGDVLTGIITALLAQGYNPLEAALIAVYIHGLSGDIAKEQKGEIGMTASDLIHYLPDAFMMLSKR